MEHIRVILMNLPHSIYGLTTYVHEDGYYFYTIFINARMSSEKQFETYKHEVSHIDNQDFSKMYPSWMIEKFAHAG